MLYVRKTSSAAQGPFSYLMNLLPVSGLAVAHLDLEVLFLLPEKEAKLLRMSEQGSDAHAGFEGGHSSQYWNIPWIYIITGEAGENENESEKPGRNKYAVGLLPVAILNLDHV